MKALEETRTRNLAFLATVLTLMLCPEAGGAGDGVVALQTADSSCRTTTTPPPIYVDCGNGTVTDNRTGLVWLANASCYGLLDWHEAVEIVANLSDIPATSAAAAHDCGLSDGSSPGEWRLPSLAEWEAMVVDAVALGNCIPTITNDSGGDCWSSGPSSFSSVQPAFYWSSTTFADNTTVAWGVVLNVGNAVGSSKASPPDNFVWPVRGGQ